jgi:hypothetical protein
MEFRHMQTILNERLTPGERFPAKLGSPIEEG